MLGRGGLSRSWQGRDNQRKKGQPWNEGKLGRKNCRKVRFFEESGEGMRFFKICDDGF